MKRIFFLIIFFISINAFSQTNFSIGFSDGYKVGYCYNQGIGCIPPIPPIAPICKIGESSNNYFDGYNRGLLLGSADKSSKLTYNGTGNSSLAYGQPAIFPEIQMFKPDYAFYENSLRQNQKNYEQRLPNNTIKNESDQYKKVLKEINEYMSSENVARREQYIKLLKQHYLSLETYPSSIPNGVYKVTTTTEPGPGQEKVKPAFKEGEAVVENNRIVLIKTHGDFTDDESYYMLSIEKFPEVKNEAEGGLGITHSYPISNGKGEIRYNVFFSGKPIGNGELKRVYFTDYIIQYQNAQKCIEVVKSKYIALKKYSPIQDGWNIVYANDGVDFCETRKVFVESGMVIKYKGSDGTDFPVTSGGKIVNNKTTISHTQTSLGGTNTRTVYTELHFL